MFAHFNIDQIWSAYSLYAKKENIKKSQEDLLQNFSCVTLKVQTINLFSLKPYFEQVCLVQYAHYLVSILSTYFPQKCKNILGGPFFKLEVQDRKCPNYHKFSIQTKFGQRTLIMPAKKI